MNSPRLLVLLAGPVMLCSLASAHPEQELGLSAPPRVGSFAGKVSFEGSGISEADKTIILAELVDAFNNYAGKAPDWNCVNPTDTKYGPRGGPMVNEGSAVRLNVFVSGSSGGPYVVKAQVIGGQLSVLSEYSRPGVLANSLNPEALNAAQHVLQDAHPCRDNRVWEGKITYEYQIKVDPVSTPLQTYSDHEYIRITIEVNGRMATAISHGELKGEATNLQKALRGGATTYIVSDSRTWQASVDDRSPAKVEVRVDKGTGVYEIVPSWTVAVGHGKSGICVRDRCQESEWNYSADPRAQGLRLTGRSDDPLKGPIKGNFGGDPTNLLGTVTVEEPGVGGPPAGRPISRLRATRTVTWDLHVKQDQR